ncbi:hypothetical protein NBRC111894_339 [Sporolactobacillus inulinus]|uniref:Uncharacterized protein n=2 Tax=Sporolactobacillus inulinus TaxID=2078 RepID=A0A4Y1Z6X9_9BACL|nr:hypothetical protein NBRC111894_339 [Sporolactobacillus inulinus]
MQKTIPMHYQGRVFTILMVGSTSLQPLGMFVYGVLFQYTSAIGIIVGSFIGMLAVSFAHGQSVAVARFRKRCFKANTLSATIRKLGFAKPLAKAKSPPATTMDGLVFGEPQDAAFYQTTYTRFLKSLIS